MTTNPHKLLSVRRVAMACAVTLACSTLAACFGDGGGDPAVPVADVPQQVPASVADSTTAYIAYALQLAPSETEEAMNLDLVAMAPTSEDDDPVVLN